MKITPLGSHDGEFCPLDHALPKPDFSVSVTPNSNSVDIALAKQASEVRARCATTAQF